MAADASDVGTYATSSMTGTIAGAGGAALIATATTTGKAACVGFAARATTSGSRESAQCAASGVHTKPSLLKTRRTPGLRRTRRCPGTASAAGYGWISQTSFHVVMLFKEELELGSPRDPRGLIRQPFTAPGNRRREFPDEFSLAAAAHGRVKDVVTFGGISVKER